MENRGAAPPQHAEQGVIPDYTAVYAAITLGKFDDHLNELLRCVRDRQKLVGTQLHRTLDVGDRVRFNDQTRPSYLIGAEATIVKKNPKTLVVLLDQPVGRFGGRVSTRMTLVEPT